MVVQPLLFALKSILQVKYEKNLMILPVSLLFSQHWTYFGPNFDPRPHQLWFFACFQWNVLGNSINIKSVNSNPVLLKNILLKPQKITIFQSNLSKKMGPHGPRRTNFFFSEITKTDHKLSKLFYFNKI